MPQSSVAKMKHPPTTTTTPSSTPSTRMPDSDDDDDYLSDKFLVPPTGGASSSAPTSVPPASSSQTYLDRRRQAQRESVLKVEINNRKNRSRKEIEEDARRQGLKKSLFDRAREQDEALSAVTTVTSTSSKPSGNDSENEEPEYALVKDPPPYITNNKAFGMMLKMGFKEGQPLGRHHSIGSIGDTGSQSPCCSTEPLLLPANGATVAKPKSPDVSVRAASPPPKSQPTSPKVSHALVEPLPLGVWAGRKGLGLGKRTFMADSDSVVSGRASKLPKIHDEDPRSRLDDEAFRNRAKEEYEERRASGNLANARRTLIDLDEKKGVKFDILWIDPHNSSTVPKELQHRLEWIADVDNDPRFLHGLDKSVNDANRSEAEKLREQMIADALRPVKALHEVDPERRRPIPRPPEEKKDPPKEFDIQVDDDMLEDTKIFLILNARARLRYTLSYLRSQHFHCFWCGVTYKTEKALRDKCPGEDETDHD